MGNTETRISPDVVAPSSQASSSTCKRLRFENHNNIDSDDVKDVKDKEKILIIPEPELVSEKLNSFEDENHSVDKPSAEVNELGDLTAVIHRHLTCNSCHKLPRVRPLMLCASGHVTCASCYHLRRSLLQCTESGCQLHVTEHPASGKAFLGDRETVFSYALS